MDERRTIKALLWSCHEQYSTRPPVEAFPSGSERPYRMVQGAPCGIPPVMPC
jgi:hypothetical protein